MTQSYIIWQVRFVACHIHSSGELSARLFIPSFLYQIRMNYSQPSPGTWQTSWAVQLYMRKQLLRSEIMRCCHTFLISQNTKQLLSSPIYINRYYLWWHREKMHTIGISNNLLYPLSHKLTKQQNHNHYNTHRFFMWGLNHILQTFHVHSKKCWKVAWS